MSTLRQGWLVARRELRERSRSNAFRVSIVIMIIAVGALIALPTLMGGSSTRDVGLTGPTPAQLEQTLQAQGEATGAPIRVHRYDTLAAGERAVRDGDVDVLVVDSQRLEWPRRIDDPLKADVVTAIQADTVRDRAAAAGVSEADLRALLAPVALADRQLGVTAGRSVADEAAAMVMLGVLLFTIATFGSLVLSGVVEEKANRVVEVLLTRVSPRTLLAGKIAGIGLLGLAQIAVTGVAALVAVAAVGTDLPSVRPSVVAWCLVWFVLGYALYATAFGVLGSLASRLEDAQSAAGPVSVALFVGYFVSFAALGRQDATWATLVSVLPPFAPLAMPGRIALGAAAWWEPWLAVVLTLLTIAALVRFGGRVYLSALLHTGEPLSLRRAWRRTAAPVAPAPTAGGPPAARPTAAAAHRLLRGMPVVIGVALGAAVALAVHDVVIGVIVGGAFVAVATQVLRLWTGHGHGGRPRHP